MLLLPSPSHIFLSFFFIPFPFTLSIFPSFRSLYTPHAWTSFLFFLILILFFLFFLFFLTFGDQRSWRRCCGFGSLSGCRSVCSWRSRCCSSRTITTSPHCNSSRLRCIKACSWYERQKERNDDDDEEEEKRRGVRWESKNGGVSSRTLILLYPFILPSALTPPLIWLFSLSLPVVFVSPLSLSSVRSSCVAAWRFQEDGSGSSWHHTFYLDQPRWTLPNRSWSQQNRQRVSRSGEAEIWCWWWGRRG